MTRYISAFIILEYMNLSESLNNYLYILDIRNVEIGFVKI